MDVTGAATRLEAYVPRIAVEWRTDAPGARSLVGDGSLVFVDISGFTALSEKLAARGRIGAEELTEAISGCFADLLAVAYADDGSLLKFGGDALLLYFSGDDHAGRASRSAIRMRQRMRTVGKLTTTVGTVRLRMSVGIHSGQLHLFRVGRTHRELILTGPGATRTVEMESVAEAGEILASEGTLSAIDLGLVGDPKGAGRLLRDKHLGPHEATFPPRAPVSPDELVGALPVALREHLMAGGGDSEHRYATIGFIHFDGTDDLIIHHGVEAAEDALDELVTQVQEAAATHEITFLATDIDKDGGKIILASGVPTTLGDDEGRMLRAVREIADRERVLPVRIGVNRGHVFAGEVGPPFRRTYTVMGDAVNLAARLMAAASPGQVLTSEDVLTRSRTAFETKRLPPIRVKGKSQPVEPCELGSVRGARRTRSSSTLSLVGRDAELDTLLLALKEATTGSGRLVELTGETGIGKSRLVDEVRARAVGVPSTVIACEQYESATPFYATRALLIGALRLPDPFGVSRDDLTAKVREIAPATERWLPLLGDVLAIPVPDNEHTAALEPKFRRERTTMAVVGLLEAAWPGAQMIAFEDVHWIDEPSGDLLSYLARTAEMRPWLIVTTRRDEQTGFRAPDLATTVRIGLEPLDASAANELVEAAAGDVPLPPHEVRALVARSGGNPLFLEELVALGTHAEVDALPESLEAVMAIQVDSLPPADRRLLRYAAVLGMSVEPDILAQLVERSSPLDAKELRAALGEFLFDDGSGRLRFRHRMLRDVAYAGLPYNTRRELHGLAGVAIEHACGDARSERAEILSLHFLNAHRFDRCWIYARAAADNARDAFANVEAAQLYERALTAARKLPDVSPLDLADTCERLGEVAMFSGAYARAHRAFRDARRLKADDKLSFAQLCLLESRVSGLEGDAVAATRWIRKALKQLESERTAEAAVVRAELKGALAFAYQQQAKPKRAVEWSLSAIEEAKSAGDGAAGSRADPRRPLADAYMVLDLAYFDLGMPELATNSEAALPLLEDLGAHSKLGILLNALGGFAYYQGRWSEAVEHYARSQQALDRSGNILEGAYARCNMAEILADQGRLDDAERALRDILKLWRSLDFAHGVGLAKKHLARIAMRRGNAEEALTLLEGARDVFASSGSAQAQLPEVDTRIAEGKLRTGDAAGARALLTEVFRRQQASGATGALPMLHRISAFARFAEGDAQGARAEAKEGLQVARARGDMFEVVLAIEAMQLLGASEPTLDAEREELRARLEILETPPPPISIGGGVGPSGS